MPCTLRSLRRYTLQRHRTAPSTPASASLLEPASVAPPSGHHDPAITDRSMNWRSCRHGVQYQVSLYPGTVIRAAFQG
jgi:hypothetical protein